MLRRKPRLVGHPRAGELPSALLSEANLTFVHPSRRNCSLHACWWIYALQNYAPSVVQGFYVLYMRRSWLSSGWTGRVLSPSSAPGFQLQTSHLMHPTVGDGGIGLNLRALRAVWQASRHPAIGRKRTRQRTTVAITPARAVPSLPQDLRNSQQRPRPTFSHEPCSGHHRSIDRGPKGHSHVAQSEPPLAGMVCDRFAHEASTRAALL